MEEGQRPLAIETISFEEAAEALRKTRIFAGANLDELHGVGRVERIGAPAGSVISEPGSPASFYFVVLKGETRAERVDADGSRTVVGAAHTGEGFGEAPLLSGKIQMQFLVTAIKDSEFIRFTDEQFWQILCVCPQVRAVILGDMALRLQAYQVEALHRQKLVSLGTLAAGLMHELHNPGSAAKRAASQLRENLMRLQQLSLRNSSRMKTPEQLECLRGLLEHTLSGCRLAAMSSLEQADAEEEMGEWLAGAGVENAYTIAPVLVGMGFDRQELDCAKDFFDTASFSDALNWLEALVSSVSLVCAIEDSITRISDLAMAVKKFAYDEKSPARELDVHDSLQSTLIILGHKLRIKQLQVEKHFEASPSTIFTRGSALSQVWTNLIDNAADASPAGGQIEVATWTEPEPGWLAVSITDHGSGIPADVLPRMFEPFFTTKPQGSGTGLGLDIVHRIVTQKFGGKIDVETAPGKTKFIVRLPLQSGNEAEAQKNRIKVVH
ncbi:MAG TPA: ATP-binding protein [Terracidiphilus sp.]|nr:ATP-binding protein [Terracidiphilus sp.]